MHSIFWELLVICNLYIFFYLCFLVTGKAIKIIRGVESNLCWNLNLCIFGSLATRYSMGEASDVFQDAYLGEVYERNFYSNVLLTED